MSKENSKTLDPKVFVKKYGRGITKIVHEAGQHSVESAHNGHHWLSKHSNAKEAQEVADVLGEPQQGAQHSFHDDQV